MTYARPDALVSTEWLAAHLDAPDVRIVDGSFFLPAQKRDPKAEFVNQHIPGAVFFDIDEIADTDNPLPHMLPSPEKFSARVRKLGLGDGNKIVVYDTSPMTGACRVWWMFRAMGHKDVAILDGGLPKWMAEGRPVTDDPTPPRERHFTARLDNTLVRSIDDVKELIDSKREQIVDARAAGRFRGEAPEPRAGPAQRPHAGRLQPALQRAARSQDRHHAAGRPAQGAHRGLGHRSVEEGHRELRLGRHRLRRRARPLSHRRAGSGDLRRLVDRMGRTCRHGHRHRKIAIISTFPLWRRRQLHKRDIQALLGRDISARASIRSDAAIARRKLVSVCAN